HHNRHYNITSSESQQRPNRRLLPINIEVINYRDGNVAELVALGNVSVTTATEWLFLRHPLARFPARTGTDPWRGEYASRSPSVPPGSESRAFPAWGLPVATCRKESDSCPTSHRA